MTLNESRSNMTRASRAHERCWRVYAFTDKNSRLIVSYCANKAPAVMVQTAGRFTQAEAAQLAAKIQRMPRDKVVMEILQHT